MESMTDNNLDKLQESLSLKFYKTGFLHQALIHSSYLNENPKEFKTSNDRLELLGDSILGAVVTSELYRLHPEWQEGKLTEARAEIVSGHALSKVGKRLNLGMYLTIGKGEESNGGRTRPSNLAATFEALVGALFLDQGFEASKNFVLDVLASDISRVHDQGPNKNPKNTLQETAQELGKSYPRYRVIEPSSVSERCYQTFNVEVIIDGHAFGRGSGSRKQEAEENAARNALKNIADRSRSKRT